ncbi:molybdopterin-dependent oxidoreductase [Enterobacter bugandensis]|uniref:molybdopterin-dependent oxidoreductase n=1 Tax=Enterobacter bugandensis TaxID=881260 RepID=UPI000668F3B1|nr:molybdopterin-dependent oxidoreductase [Enterobacter bugandensis]
MSEQLVPGYCALCRSRCGTLNEIIDGRLVSVRPDHNHPTGGAVCLKGKAAPELIYSEARVLWPQRRTQPKDAEDPGWERISWDEALTEIADKLTQFKTESGAESVAFGVTTPSGTPIIDSVEWIERFVRLYGSPNTCYSTEVCNWHKDTAHTFTFGCITPAADYSNSELIILWGNNPAATWLAQASAIGEGRKKGARMLVVDPRHTEFAREADVWLNIHPGTDAVLAMGLTRQMLQEQGYNDSFVRTWTDAPLLVSEESGLFLREQDITPDSITNHYLLWDRVDNVARPCTDSVTGDEAFYERAALAGSYPLSLANGETVVCRPALEVLQQAVAKFTPEHVATVTGISIDKQQAALALIRGSSRIAYHAWVGIAQSRNATQTERAIAILYALTGAFDTRGSNRIYAKPPFNSVNLLSLLPESQRKKALGFKERPLGPPASGYITTADLHRAILEHKPYKVRGLVCFGSNMLSSHGNVDTAIEALKQLEFHVHCDHFVTPTSRFADIFLPASTLWEHEALKIGFEISERADAHVQLRPQLVPPLGESLADYEIVFRLACKIGMGEHFFHGDIDAGFNHILKPSGITLEMLRMRPGGITVDISNDEKKYALREASNGKLRGFSTETGKVEIYSERLLRHGYSPVPQYIEDAPKQEAFPLRLTAMKNALYCHSQHRSLISLRRKSPDPLAIISRAVANNAGIDNKDWIEITSPTGQAHFRAKIDDAIHDDVVIAEYGWWQGCPDLNKPELPVSGKNGSNYNMLINYAAVDGISGSVPLRTMHCAVRKVADALAWKGERRFTVSSIIQETPDVRSISFVPVDGTRLPGWLAGQAVILRVFPQDKPEGISRAYTLSNAPGREACFTVSVRLQPQGMMSSFIHRQLQTGDEVTLTAPDGNFVIPTQSIAPVIMIAGGIGITPFISYLNSLEPTANTPEMWLYYGNRNSQSHAFRKELQALSRRLPRLNVVNIYDNPLPGDIMGEHYQQTGIITAALFDETLIRSRARFYLCGPIPMIDSLESGLHRRGVFAFDIFKEQFAPPAVRITSKKDCYQVFFARSGVKVQWTPAAGTLLELGEKHQIHMSGGCRAGQCECCAVKLTAGVVDSLSEQAVSGDGICLACQCIPASDIVIDA